MMTSLNEIQQIEKNISGEGDIDESLLFEARLLTNPQLKINHHLQKKVVLLVKLFYRKKIRAGIETTSNTMFTSPKKKDFQQKIFHIFNS
jgi:hypothetical protein